MNQKVYFRPLGRLGNALFRYFAIVLILDSNDNLIYGELNVNKEPSIVLNDKIFKHLISNNCLKINIKSPILLDGYYQIQELSEYREKIKLLLKQNQSHKIYNYPYEEYKIMDIVNAPPNLKTYDIVIHIRLEDFIGNNEFIKKEHIVHLLNTLTRTFFYNTTAIVVNQPKSTFEINYIDELKKWFSTNSIHVTIESNDVITDFHIMKNAKKLICSNSTLSWCAAFLSDTIEICYMPDYRNDRIHQTLKYPIKNTILYSI